MGSNGTFATAQNGQPGSGSPFYQFMGPTLWSSDTAVFASRYQTDNTMLASHLDMLHQSPQNLGIAHDHDNVYWVSDSYYNDVARYDFRDPHEVGGTDHRDGIIRRYTDVRITGGLRGEPGHLALHKQSGWLYIVDPGANRVLRLQTTSGHYTKTLFPPDESMEYLAEYSEYNGADVEVVVADGIGEPVGIEVDNNRLFVGDRSTGQIYIFRITDTGVEPLGTVQTGAEELMGICYGPDQRLWFVDRAQGTVNRLETTSDHSLTPVVDVTAVATEDVIRFRYTNASATTREVQFKGFLREATADGYGSVIPFQNITPVAINGNSTVTVPVSVVLPDTTSAWEVTLVEDDGSAVGGIRASTTVVPRNVRRIIADDALMETFRITEAVRQTNREGYMSLRSDVFIRVADSLKSLQTVLWNGGSFGEISVADDAVINSLLDRGIEVMLIADDPLLQRLDLPNANGFFRRFGIRLAGADTRPSDEGQRILFGIHGDTISGAFGLVDCQLPRLDHARGNNFIPNVYFQAVEEGCVPVFNGNYLQRVQTARYEAETYKSVIHGMNAERFLNGLQRTEFLDKALMWLETQVSKDTTIPDTTVSVKEDRQPNAVTVSIAGNVSADAITISVVGTSPQAVIAIYAPTGQRMADLHEGPLTGNMVITQNIRTLPFGTYFVVVTTPDGVRHSTFQKQ